MAVYEPVSPELGKNAIGRRVGALRAMNEAGGAQFKRYTRGTSSPTYQVVTVHGEERELTTREVAAYVLGQADSYTGVRYQVQEALDAALSDPGVSDRESLVRAVLSGLDDRCGEHLQRAAGHFSARAERPVEAVA